MQNNFVVDELVLRMLLWESAVFRSLNLCFLTSNPRGFKKNSRCSSAFANIFLAILGMKVVIFTKVKIIMKIYQDKIRNIQIAMTMKLILLFIIFRLLLLLYP